jgi:hypothetical protein
MVGFKGARGASLDCQDAETSKKNKTQKLNGQKLKLSAKTCHFLLLMKNPSLKQARIS